MADKAPEYQLGERMHDAFTQVVEYAGTIAKGDFLKVTGVTDFNQYKVQKQTTNTDACFVAIQDGVSGETHNALQAGTTKVTFGGNVTVGEFCTVKANKCVNTGTTGTGSDCGRIISNGGADGDTGLIYFTGFSAGNSATA